MNFQASSASSSSSHLEASEHEDQQGSEPEEPFSWDGPSISLLGLLIAIATIGIPFGVVLADRPLGGLITVPTVSKSDGSQSTSAISFTRTSKSISGDTSGKQE